MNQTLTFVKYDTDDEVITGQGDKCFVVDCQTSQFDIASYLRSVDDLRDYSVQRYSLSRAFRSENKENDLKNDDLWTIQIRIMSKSQTKEIQTSFA